MSLFRYGLDYVQMAIQRLIGFGKKEFKEILAILRRQNPDRISHIAKPLVLSLFNKKSILFHLLINPRFSNLCRK